MAIAAESMIGLALAFRSELTLSSLAEGGREGGSGCRVCGDGEDGREDVQGGGGDEGGEGGRGGEGEYGAEESGSGCGCGGDHGNDCQEGEREMV